MSEIKKRQPVKTGYIMQITAEETCARCLGTGINAEQHYNATFRKLDIEVSVCSCVRVVPRLAGEHA
jgi:hypothetical protein